MNTEDKLTELSELKTLLSSLASDYQDKIDQVIAKVQPELNDLSDEYNPQIEELEFRIERLTQSIKEDVINQGKTIKSDKLMAVYTSPRITWDNKGLEGYMVVHPEIKVFQNIGKASVSIREVK